VRYDGNFKAVPHLRDGFYAGQKDRNAPKGLLAWLPEAAQEREQLPF
jgi:hypothetical protein